jgi:hypothetical protein
LCFCINHPNSALAANTEMTAWRRGVNPPEG